MQVRTIGKLFSVYTELIDSCRGILCQFRGGIREKKDVIRRYVRRALSLELGVPLLQHPIHG